MSNNKSNVKTSAGGASGYQHFEEEDDDFDLMNNDDDDEDEEQQEDDMDENFMDDDENTSDTGHYNNNNNTVTPKSAVDDSTRPKTDAISIDPHSAKSLTPSSAANQNNNSNNSLSMSQRSNSILASRSRRNYDLDDEFKYEVLTPDKIVQHMIECIKEVNQVIQLPPTTTRILLHHFRWDKEKLMERFYDGDQDRLFHEAHVVSPYKHYARQNSGARGNSASSSSSSTSVVSNCTVTSKLKPKEYFCEICCVSCPDDNMSGLECGHMFCKFCWQEYLKTKIMDEGMGLTISCAAHNCDILVDDNTVM